MPERSHYLDFPMTADLPAALLALLREVRQEIPHDTYCSEILAWRGGAERDCQCKRQARVDAEIARRWVASIEAAMPYKMETDPTSNGYVMRQFLRAAAFQAARAARSTP